MAPRRRLVPRSWSDTRSPVTVEAGETKDVGDLRVRKNVPIQGVFGQTP